MNAFCISSLDIAFQVPYDDIISFFFPYVLSGINLISPLSQISYDNETNMFKDITEKETQVNTYNTTWHTRKEMLILIIWLRMSMLRNFYTTNKYIRGTTKSGQILVWSLECKAASARNCLNISQVELWPIFFSFCCNMPLNYSSRTAMVGSERGYLFMFFCSSAILSPFSYYSCWCSCWYGGADKPDNVFKSMNSRMLIRCLDSNLLRMLRWGFTCKLVSSREKKN